MTRFRVIEAHKASYEDPIAFSTGDAIHLTGREDIWDGHRWLWAIAPDGRQGWIPDSFAIGGEMFVADQPYTAIELTIEVGEVISGDAETHGWVWATNAAGASGWAPLRSLTPI